MPRAFGFHAWYEEKFGDLCKQHDHHYTTAYPRKQADLELTAGIVLRGYPALALLTYIFVRGIGWKHYRKPI